MKFIVNNALHQGKRSYQEDCYIINHPLYIMADGMGGEGDGDFASNVFTQIFNKAWPHILKDSESIQSALIECVAFSNLKLLEAIKDELKSYRAGSTFLFVYIDEENKKIHFGSIGDSTIYIIDTKTIRAERNKHHETGNGQLTSSTGIGLNEIWYDSIDLVDNLVILMATDGLEFYTRLNFRNQDFFNIVVNEIEPSTLAENLVNRTIALNHPKQDNVAVISIVVIHE